MNKSFAALTFALLLPACGGNISGAPAARSALTPAVPTLRFAAAGKSWISPAAQRSKLLYISRYSYNDVQIYDSRTLKQVGVISGVTNPQGVALDKRRNVYVADQGANAVEVFHRGQTTPFETLTDSDGYLFQVVVGNDGTVYVSNEYGLSLGNGNVIEYAPGATTPSREITDRHFNLVEDAGVDSRNNLYVSFFDEHVVGRVNEYSPGSTHGKRLSLSLSGAAGIDFDAADDLVVVDTIVPDVKVFAQGSSSPKYEFAQGLIDPWDVALARRANRAFVTEPYTGNTYEYALPSGKQLHVISNPPNTTGVAVEQ
jgi:hypothetical protein